MTLFSNALIDKSPDAAVWTKWNDELLCQREIQKEVKDTTNSDPLSLH
jgi:hypothetical protein